MASTGRVLPFKLFSFFLVVVNQGKNLFLFVLAAGGGSKAPAENIAGFGDNHKSAGVFFAYNLANARNLCKLGNNTQHFALLMCLSTFAV